MAIKRKKPDCSVASSPSQMAPPPPTPPPPPTTTTIEDLHPDIIVRALRWMDGPTLAAASCTTTLLRSLTSNPALWRRLCLYMWPSLSHPRLLDLLSGSYRSFFSDAFPFPDDTAVKLLSPRLEKKLDSSIPGIAGDDQKSALLSLHNFNGSIQGSVITGDEEKGPACLISAVDLYHEGIPIFSHVIETDTSSAWFLTSPFRIDGLDRKDREPYPSAGQLPINPEELTLSWTLIDPAAHRAVNVSSRTPVAIDRHWYTGETRVRFAVVLWDCAVSAVVTCAEDTGQVTEVSLRVESMDGIWVSGRDGLVILKAAMDGRRRGLKTQQGLKIKYEEFLRKKKEIIERKARRERILDLCCTGFGALMFLSFLTMLAFR